MPTKHLGEVIAPTFPQRSFVGKQDQSSIFANPKFANAIGEIFRLLGGSPARNAGNPAFVPAAGETDYYGVSRVLGGGVDLGATELN